MKPVRLLMLLLMLHAGLLSAQTVYRCGPQGREYSQQPCPGGRALEVGDPRPADERSQTAKATQADARAAAALARDRAKRDSQVGAGPASLGRGPAVLAAAAAASAAAKKPPKRRARTEPAAALHR